MYGRERIAVSPRSVIEWNNTKFITHITSFSFWMVTLCRQFNHIFYYYHEKHELSRQYQEKVKNSLSLSLSNSLFTNHWNYSVSLVLFCFRSNHFFRFKWKSIAFNLKQKQGGYGFCERIYSIVIVAEKNFIYRFSSRIEKKKTTQHLNTHKNRSK